MNGQQAGGGEQTIGQTDALQSLLANSGNQQIDLYSWRVLRRLIHYSLIESQKLGRDLLRQLLRQGDVQTVSRTATAIALPDGFGARSQRKIPAWRRGNMRKIVL